MSGPWEVTLHVYDLSNGMAKMLSRQLVGRQIDGIWHTGVVVYGREYYWGGNLQNGTPSRTPYGVPVRIEKIGTTHIPQDFFEDWVAEVSPQYTVQTYDLLSKNCNNFSHEACTLLTGSSIPDDIRNLPDHFLTSPMGMALKPFIDMYQNSMKQQLTGVYPAPSPVGLPNFLAHQNTSSIPLSSPSSSPATGGRVLGSGLPQSAPGSSQPSAPKPKLPSERKHILPSSTRKPMLSAHAVDVKVMVTKVLNLPELNLSTEDKEAMTAAAAYAADKKASVPNYVAATKAVLNILKNITIPNSFNALFVFRVLLLDAKFRVELATAAPDLGHVILYRFLDNKVTPAVKTMALVSLTNMFAGKETESLLLSTTARDILISRLIKLLDSKRKEVRVVAAGLMQNYAAALRQASESEDDVLQCLSAIANLLIEGPKEKLDTSETIFTSRLVISLGYLAEDNEDMKSLAVGLGVVDALEKIATIPGAAEASEAAKECLFLVL